MQHQPSEEAVNLFILTTWLQTKLGADERGASMIEYGLLLAFVAVLCLVAVQFFGEQTSARFSSINSSIN
jgi:pilus assembly protein Flp/PilA